MVEKITMTPIGIIKTPHKTIEGMPIQPTGAKGIKGELHIKEEFADGLKDLEGFSHINILYHFHKVNGYSLEVHPFLDNKTHGIFATRSPKRPNKIGSSIVKVDKVENNIVYISNIDVLDETPLLDIKPHVPHLYEDTIENLQIGWFETKADKAKTKKSDDRFK